MLFGKTFTSPSMKYLLFEAQTDFSLYAKGLSSNASSNNLSSGKTGRKSEDI